MDLRQKTQLQRLLLPGLQQSLKILPLNLLDLKHLLENELLNNPFLEEGKALLTAYKNKQAKKDLNFLIEGFTRKTSLKDSLVAELGMFAKNDLELKIGEEIIANIDENGYLKAGVEEIADILHVEAYQVEEILRLIQQFEPPGVASRSIQECLLIQLDLSNDNDPLTRKIIGFHIEDIAKKNYSRIAKDLKEPLEKIETCVKKILKLNPKPGRNFSQEEIHHIIPDIIIEEKDEGEFEISINDEDIPTVNINKDYKAMLKDAHLDPPTREFLASKLRSALELLRAINKRQATLRKIVEVIAEIQKDAIIEGLSYLKPLTILEVARRIDMHESTVSRAIMNKYVKLPYGTVALKSFFSSHIQAHSGESLSSNYVKKLIKELIDREDKKQPLSDQQICAILNKEKNLNIKRRTVSKYREELKLLSSTFRKER